MWPGKAWTSATSCVSRVAAAGPQTPLRNAEASGAPLKRPEHQLAAHVPVEAGPVEIGQIFPQQGGGVGHVGDPVRLARGEPVECCGEIAVERGLVGGGDDVEREHSGDVRATPAARQPTALPSPESKITYALYLGRII